MDFCKGNGSDFVILNTKKFMGLMVMKDEIYGKYKWITDKKLPYPLREKERGSITLIELKRAIQEARTQTIHEIENLIDEEIGRADPTTKEGRSVIASLKFIRQVGIQDLKKAIKEKMK